MRPLFFATNESYKMFKDPQQKQFVEEGMRTLLEKNVIDPDPDKRFPISFELNYNRGYHIILSPLWGKIWPKQSLENEKRKIYSEFEFYQAIDKQALRMSFVLIKNNFVNFTKSYIKDIVRGFGGDIFFGFIFLCCILFFGKIISTSNVNVFYSSFIFSSLIHLSNIAFVCLFEPPLFRYTYATGLLLLSMLIIMIYLLDNNPQLTSSDSSCAE
jgi:hypothetical protein